MRRGATNILEGSIIKDRLIKLGIHAIVKYIRKVKKNGKSFTYLNNYYEEEVNLGFYYIT